MNNIIKKFKQKRKTANARKWKHKDGGKAFVKGVNVLDSNPNAYKYVKKKYKMRSAQQGTKFDWGQLASTGVNLLNSYLSTKASNKETDNDYQTQIASLELERNQKNKSIPYYAQMIAAKMQNKTDPENPNANAGVPSQILPYKIADYLQSQNDKEYNDKIKALEMRSQQLKDQSNTNFWMGAAQEGLGLLMNNIGKGTSNTSSNSGNLSSGTTPLTNSSININNQYSLMNQNPQYWNYSDNLSSFKNWTPK